jgi:hypothetical protein
MRFLQAAQFDSLSDLNSWLKDRGERPDVVSITPFVTGASGECRERDPGDGSEYGSKKDGAASIGRCCLVEHWVEG